MQFLSIVIRKARIEDTQVIMDMTNKAYSIYFGSTGIAFKRTNRYPGPRYQNTSEIETNLDSFYVLLQDKKIIGAVKAKPNGSIVKIGSLAIDPDHQGKGYGSKLLTYVESLAPVAQLPFISCQTNLLPFYFKRGYREVRRQFISELIASEPSLADVTRDNLELITLQK